MRLLIFSVSFFAIGLYRLYVRAVPAPSSTSDKTVNMFEKSPFTPKYSLPSVCTKIILAIREISSPKNWPAIAYDRFFMLFLVLEDMAHFSWLVLWV